ncbi:MAG: peptidylprolyl isomerase [Armatimonadota bacterium]|nr:peptidylprolyl isomerase [Armatimonadota bacterium]
MQRIRRTLAVTVALMSILLGSELASGQEGTVMATVNGQPVTAGQLQGELLRRWGDICLGGLIQELAVKQAADEVGITVTDEEVEERYENFQRNLDLQAPTTGRSFSLWLAEKKMTPYAFREWIRNELRLEKMVEDEVTVSDEEVQQVWEASREQLRQPERMRISHICVKTREEAEQIRAEIIDGKPFEEAAEEYSIDPYTKDQGGKFGTITRGDNPFQKAAFELGSDNELSEPVQTQMGWHIIRRDEHLPAQTPEFEEVKDDIRERLERHKLLTLMNRKRSEIMNNARIQHEMEPEELAD